MRRRAKNDIINPKQYRTISTRRPGPRYRSEKIRAIPHNSKCQYGERGAADAKPKAQIILCCIIEHFGNADAVPQPPERCLSRKAGIVRCCLRQHEQEQPTMEQNHKTEPKTCALQKKHCGGCPLLSQPYAAQLAAKQSLHLMGVAVGVRCRNQPRRREYPPR